MLRVSISVNNSVAAWENVGSVKTDETAKAAHPKVAEIVFSIQENRLSRSCQMPQTSYTEREKDTEKR